MKFQIFDNEASNLIAADAELVQLATGFKFTEGPVWDFKQGRLIFSDIPANTLYSYSEATGARVYRQPSHFSNGLCMDSRGRLMACEHQTRRVSREGVNGEIEILTSHYQGKRLNSPNDLIVTRDGSIIFTDPHYGLLPGLGGPAEQEQPHRGVYRIPPGATEPVLLVDDFEAPNGLALNADESILYVDDSECKHIRVFNIAEDGSLSGGDVLVTFTRGEGEGGDADGMKIAASGHIFCTGPGGIWIIHPQGTVIARIMMPEVTANLRWGDADRQTLYMTASTSIYKLRCLTSGLV